MLKQLESDIWFFIEENNITNFGAVLREFGSPESIAESCLLEAGAEKTNKPFQMNRGILRAIYAIVLVTLVLLIAIEAYDQWKRDLFDNGIHMPVIVIPPGDTIEDAFSRSLP